MTLAHAQLLATEARLNGELEELLAMDNIKDIWQQRRAAMFAAQEDVNDFLFRYFLSFQK